MIRVYNTNANGGTMRSSEYGIWKLRLPICRRRLTDRRRRPMPPMNALRD